MQIQRVNHRCRANAARKKRENENIEINTE